MTPGHPTHKTPKKTKSSSTTLYPQYALRYTNMQKSQFQTNSEKMRKPLKKNTFCVKYLNLSKKNKQEVK
jgi:hypothetical protein